MNKSLNFYKPRQDGRGSASQWSLGSKNDCVFLEMSKEIGKDENGNSRFDWPKKLKFKLDELDIGEILSVIYGRQTGIGPKDPEKGRHKGLFHQNDKGNSILSFEESADSQQVHTRLSAKIGDEQNFVQLSMRIPELCLLKIFLEGAIRKIYCLE